MLVTLFDLILLVCLPLLALRLYRPWSRRPGGILVRRAPLPLLARLRLHRRPAMVVLTAGAAGLVAGRVHLWSLGIAAVVLAALIAVPVAYTLTDEAIALGRTAPRRWTEFGGVGRRPGGARLQGIAGARGMTVWLSDSRGDDEFVLLLRRLVRGSYKGEIGPASRDSLAEVDPRSGLPWETAQVADG
jgi:hypothetical protein